VKSIIGARFNFAAEPEAISTVLTGTASIPLLKVNVESVREATLIEEHLDRLKNTLSHIVGYA